MRQIYLQKEFYQLARKNIPHPSEEAEHREGHLRAWEKLREQGMGSGEASAVVGQSRATMYRWQKRFRSEGWKGLEERSRRPKRIRKRQWGSDLIEEVRSLREIYPA